MQILKGSKDRKPEFNEFIYSKGSVHGEYSLDRDANMLDACLRTAKSNDYSNAAAELNRLDMLRIDTILKRYPPQFCPAEERELVEVDGDKIRWNPEGLLIKIKGERTCFSNIFHWIDYDIVNRVNNKGLHHTDREFKDVLNAELDRFEQLINNPAG